MEVVVDSNKMFAILAAIYYQLMSAAVAIKLFILTLKKVNRIIILRVYSNNEQKNPQC